ncbi:GTPase activating protein, putative [Entamoeba dispar SAW760]|uniref:GTPase activating protein, putative n=1 Tax=Entamoeba dispar (strain ATCC PRA-260 / SAW760) TaxID=370354 RepID=B0EBY3_ENTDS|nr:GTPase activating protein, putative [Entamoeba dispar SAW760]EDR27968.1 GTPase activating protein, putative [Entamoeba dispar SAW760]|eukprot:EDR27968.1 GTPase activating protein, putative [Entamoeba dispar SAW760]
MGGTKSKPINYNNVKLSTDTVDLTIATPNTVFSIINDEDAKIKYVIDNYTTNDYSIVYSPAKGVLSPRSRKEVKVLVTFKQKVNVNLPVTIHIADKAETFFSLRLRGEDGVFGVDPTNLEWIETGKYKLPKPLAILNNNFQRLDGFHSEGVFRLAGQAGLMKTMKSYMNTHKGDLEVQEEFTINEVANLIKLWFRELPTLLLNGLTSTQIQMSGVDDCWKQYCTLSQQSRDLLDWLFSLLVHVSLFKDQNKMTLQNLAIVVAPNLYESTSSDPMEGLMMSQKAVQFVQNILTHFAETPSNN